MRKIQKFIFVPFLLLAMILPAGCKKKTTTPANQTQITFEMQYYSFNLGGVNYVRFIFENKSAAVTIATLTLLAPDGETYTYTGDATVIEKGQMEELPDDFPLVAGSWKFTYTGKVSSSGEAYTSVAYCLVTN